MPRQIEFARLNLTYTLTSKRKLKRLMDEGLVDGWDDPRMPTLTALRRRGCPPEALRELCARIGLTKNDSVVDLSQLEFAIRNELNRTSPRVMAVLRPLKVVIENYPDDQVDEPRRDQQPGGRFGRGPARCRSPRCCTSSGTTSGGTRRGSSSGSRRAGKCGSATPTS